MALVFLSLTLAGQQPQTNVTFKTTSNLVVVDVFARNRSGAAVENLKKEDFTITEDGKPEQISVFEFERLSGERAAPAPAPPKPVAAPTVVRADAINIASPGKVQYQDKRLMVFFFDMSSMSPSEQIRAQEAALQFVEQQLTRADLVAIMTFAAGVKVVQDFTDDRDRLVQIIKKFRIGEASELSIEADTGDPNVGEDTGAAFIADETEFNIFNTDRKLAALETAVQMLAPLPEKKALVYFSSGVGKTGVENHSQLRATVNAAIRANVSFYPVDARGLVALVPGGDASKAAPRGTGVFTGQAQTRLKERFNDQQETLFTLAADSGGKALLDSNDLLLGIQQAQENVTSYYVLGYYSTNGAQDGRFRRIQVSLPKSYQAKLDYRSGYFAPKEFGRFTAGDKERQLQEALLLGDPVTDLPLVLEINYFRLVRDRYFVPVAVKVPGSEIALARRGANEVAEFDFIGQVLDTKGRIAANVRDTIQVRLGETGAAQLNKRQIQYDTGFTLTPGRYVLKFLARENRSGRMGTFETEFTIPNLGVEQSGLRISSVVWSGQREPLSAAVGAGENQKLLANHPLVSDGQKLIPSITRVFSRKQNLYVYFEVYDPAEQPERKAPRVMANVTFYRRGLRAFESEPLRLGKLSDRRSGAMPVQFQIPLEKLKAGSYVCQVNVIDEVGRKFEFLRAPMVLVP